ncbi:MAG: 30S ribosome-binding factor RbfA [Candidatus Binatia bacterium]
MSGRRPGRVGALLQAALSEVLLRGVKDPRVGMVTITGVDLSPDLKHATVFVSTHGDAESMERTLAGLESARPYLQSQVGRRLGLRFTPELRFAIDPSIDTAARLEQLFRETQPAPANDDDDSDGRDDGEDPDDDA